MTVFTLRFDFRDPGLTETGMADRYAAALEMAEWADRLGFLAVTLSEHHGSDDGYLPAPLTFAAAIAARTERMIINFSAIPAPLHDPLHLAEQIAVVDLLSRGRVSVVLANGYIPSEFDMFGVSLRDRAARTTETVRTLRAAWTGEPFQHRGRTVRVTPTPHQPGGPKISLGGSVEAAARRAARIADGFVPSWPGVWEHYRDERINLGHPDPGPHFGGNTDFVHLSKDPDRDWARIAPHALHESTAYGAHSAAAGTLGHGVYTTPESAEALRAGGQYRVITPEQLTGELTNAGDAGLVVFHPLMGGIAPELAWESLRLFETDVLPRLRVGT
ncbi:LLM class flavin-dependent oxidoreductase [Yinghuangia sp. YIM S09857]|uniref:LLM class flavin-dependent oxidoreductase n=1 Tax=Yinghuangia sp. YIM S09857 TaxID=3436929 RepID=UPI003F52A5DB